MKKVFVLIIALFPIVIFAQEESGFSVVGGFGSPIMQISDQQGMSISLGGEGAVLFKNGLFIGGFGQETSSMSKNKASHDLYSNYHKENEYGGIWIGYVYRLNKRFYLNFSGKIGGGEVSFNDRENQLTTYDKVWMLKPQVGLDVKLLKVIAVTTGVGYNHFGAVNLEGQGAGQFNGFEAFIGLKMG
ncbi:MAG: hypothetical protein C0599_03930 [Salinivirgaceae bacterium]|nr:MAG: hypothetical protein C0599_03930 [Salinivirgaceae bacterium]